MVSLPEQLGLSEDEWKELDPEAKSEMARVQAKLIADQQMLGTQILREDQSALERRRKTVEAQILGRDANTCDDTPVDAMQDEPMQIHSLGDVIIGDRALASLSKNSQSNIDPPPPPPAPPKKRGVPKWLLPIAGAAMGAGLTFGAANYFGGSDTQNAYDLQAIEYYPQEPTE